MQLSACSDTPAEGVGEEPASVEPIKGTDYNTIVLSGRAAERVGVKTSKVREQNGHKVIPYDAVNLHARRGHLHVHEQGGVHVRERADHRPTREKR